MLISNVNLTIHPLSLNAFCTLNFQAVHDAYHFITFQESWRLAKVYTIQLLQARPLLPKTSSSDFMIHSQMESLSMDMTSLTFSNWIILSSSSFLPAEMMKTIMMHWKASLPHVWIILCFSSWSLQLTTTFHICLLHYCHFVFGNPWYISNSAVTGIQFCRTSKLKCTTFLIKIWNALSNYFPVL